MLKLLHRERAPAKCQMFLNGKGDVLFICLFAAYTCVLTALILLFITSVHIMQSVGSEHRFPCPQTML